MFDELWSEINDSQGEIFDVIDYKEEWEEKENKFDVEDYINSNIDYWSQLTNKKLTTTPWLTTSSIATSCRQIISTAC